MKTVGKRKAAKGLKQASKLTSLVTVLRGDKPLIPRGVHRFATFEDAEKWSLKMKTRRNPDRQR